MSQPHPRPTEAARPAVCDTCDTMLRNDDPPPLSDRQRRFLAAYQERLAVAPAARLAGVHRASVYRWRADPAFVAAMRAAAEVFFEEHQRKVRAEEAARQAWRDARERERHPQRCLTLARVRAAKQR